jgi:hypothetical protein
MAKFEALSLRLLDRTEEHHKDYRESGNTLTTYETSKKSKAILVTGLGGPQGCEMSRIPHCLDNRYTVNCEILAICSSTYSPVRTS